MDDGGAPEGFSISHAKGGAFERGLRSFFAYRDLGIEAATAGDTVAHVIRAVPGERSPGGWHRHDCHFQMVYVLAGWVEFEYEGVGRVRLEPGTCVHQPKGIRHREIRHSDDLELLEIASPAGFGTEACEAPAGRA